MAVATHVFRVALNGAPKIWREIEIGSKSTLYSLAEGIMRSFDFDFDHAFSFYSQMKGRYLDSMPRYELFNDIGEDTGGYGVERVKVEQAFTTPKQKMLFLFDYGDGWEFSLELLRFGTSEKRLPKAQILAAKGVAPVQYPQPDDEEESEEE